MTEAMKGNFLCNTCGFEPVFKGGREIHEGSGKSSKTNWVGWRGSPQSSNACGEMGIYSTPFVFCWVKLRRACPFIICISFHCIFWISQWRKPVSAEKRAARFKSLYSQGVAASVFNSSTVRNSRRVSCPGMPLILADKSIVRYPSIKACFKAACMSLRCCVIWFRFCYRRRGLSLGIFWNLLQSGYQFLKMGGYPLQKVLLIQECVSSLHGLIRNCVHVVFERLI